MYLPNSLSVYSSPVRCEIKAAERVRGKYGKGESFVSVAERGCKLLSNKNIGNHPALRHKLRPYLKATSHRELIKSLIKFLHNFLALNGRKSIRREAFYELGCKKGGNRRKKLLKAFGNQP